MRRITSLLAIRFPCLLLVAHIEGVPPTTNENLLTTKLDYDEFHAAWLRNSIGEAIKKVLKGLLKNGPLER